ncbi:related to alpha-aminoadipate reductase [Sporisorium reilianum f. sp. reilianum]|uniref:Related to alpha-aminoadipate reductase n=1 Tax=Sporisorium reilianum f. sp. reilianum TaxID=72559 RepID=A0A2N8ULD5_9BASI|nr:related to alpha-aminoadipate reductase [Sporisorium reilianum f. sp. reilianum]
MSVASERVPAATGKPVAWPSLNALFADRVDNMRDTVFLRVPKHGAADHASGFACDEYTFGQVDGLANNVAASYASKLPPKQPGVPSRAVGVFAPSGFDYVVHALALFRLGHTVIYLSTNNSTAALAHLIKVTSAQNVLYSADKANAMASLKPLLKEQGLTSVELQQWTPVSEASKQSLARTMDASLYTSALSHEQETTEVAFCIHSSGSTGFPKPNFFTMLWSSIWSGRKSFLYDGRLSADLLTAAIKASSAGILALVPYVLKLLAESETGLTAFEGVACVYSAGSACPTDIGDKLVQDDNVPLCTGYGSSEAGSLMTSFRDFGRDKEWEYMRPTPAFEDFMKFENRGTDASGPFELIVGAGWPHLTETNRPDGSYATKDLFVPHANKPDLYKYVGRADDTLVHYNGEKTNPVPMELAMRASPYVADCLIFGAGRSQAGVLIVPSEYAVQEARTQAFSEDSRHEHLNKLVWKAVEAGNKEAPSHSQIVPELVKLLPSGSKFPSADKGSMIRAKAVKAFEREIDEVYADYEADSSGAATTPKMTLRDLDTSIQVAAQAVSEVTGRSASDLQTKLKDADFMDLGIDSLQAARIRNLLRKRVELASDLPGNLIFEYPSITQLAGCLVQRSLGDTANGTQEQAEISKALARLEEFQNQIKTREVEPQTGAAKHTVVLTGSTGSLGAHILHQLSRIDRVEMVICLNRAKDDEDARKRTEDSLLIRDLGKLDALASSSNTSIVCLASDLTKPNLGLSPEPWKLVSSKTTCVIHNGWPVNFNMSVQSFRGAIQGSVNLINLVAQTPATSTPRFTFSSSISAVLGQTTPQVDEQYPDRVTDALKMGYGRSKWIVEKLCSYAQGHVGGGFDAVVARIGQMVGDRRSGIWNETEAAPLMIKSAQTVGCLPGLAEPVFWQPVDDSGFIMAHLVVPPRLEGVVHVLNPSATPYSQLIEALAKPENLGNSFEVVEPTEWVRRLSESDPDPERNPTIKLLDHYRANYGKAQPNGVEAADKKPKQQQKAFGTDRLRSIFKQLGLQRELESKLVPVDATLINNIVAAWKRTGFLK